MSPMPAPPASERGCEGLSSNGDLSGTNQHRGQMTALAEDGRRTRRWAAPPRLPGSARWRRWADDGARILGGVPEDCDGRPADGGGIQRRGARTGGRRAPHGARGEDPGREGSTAAGRPQKGPGGRRGARGGARRDWGGGRGEEERMRAELEGGGAGLVMRIGRGPTGRGQGGRGKRGSTRGGGAGGGDRGRGRQRMVRLRAQMRPRRIKTTTTTFGETWGKKDTIRNPMNSYFKFQDMQRSQRYVGPT